MAHTTELKPEPGQENGQLIDRIVSGMMNGTVGRITIFSGMAPQIVEASQ